MRISNSKANILFPGSFKNVSKIKKNDNYFACLKANSKVVSIFKKLHVLFSILHMDYEHLTIKRKFIFFNHRHFYHQDNSQVFNR